MVRITRFHYRGNRAPFLVWDLRSRKPHNPAKKKIIIQ